MPVSPADVAAAVRRLRCTPAEALALAVLAAGALLALGLLWLLARPELPGTIAAALPTEVASDSGGLEVSAGEVVVHVAGAVHSPGVYTLAGGSRVGEAIAAAGGPRRKAVLDGLNLARPLTDGEQVVVPDRRVAAQPPADTTDSGGTGSAAAPGTPINLNQATPADLEELPNIGPVLAQRIVDHRESIGGFTEIGQLRDVPGIGEKTFQALAELVTV